MKKITFLLLIFSSLLANAQSNKIRFEYDNAGNQIKRELCSNCPSKNNDYVPIENLKEQDLLKFFSEDVISYYPNPVKDELFLKWDLIQGKNVNAIEIYSITGQLVKKINNLETSNQLNISFNDFREGTYLVVLLYSNGEQKDIKIVKK